VGYKGVTTTTSGITGQSPEADFAFFTPPSSYYMLSSSQLSGFIHQTSDYNLIITLIFIGEVCQNVEISTVSLFDPVFFPDGTSQLTMTQKDSNMMMWQRFF
jgi:hypothetical protein